MPKYKRVVMGLWIAGCVLLAVGVPSCNANYASVITGAIGFAGFLTCISAVIAGLLGEEGWFSE